MRMWCRLQSDFLYQERSQEVQKLKLIYNHLCMFESFSNLMNFNKFLNFAKIKLLFRVKCLRLSCKLLSHSVEFRVGILVLCKIFGIFEAYATCPKFPFMIQFMTVLLKIISLC